MNEKFYSLPLHKQELIMNSGYKVFGCYPYPKAPMSEIAKEAGISKSLLFHYFKNKRTLYIFLFKNAIQYLKRNKKVEYPLSRDFFDLIKITISLRMKSISKHPYICNFITSVNNENDRLLKQDIEQIKDKFIITEKSEVLRNIDVSLFKYPEDISIIYDSIIFMSEGFILKNMDNILNNSESTMDEYYDLLEALKRNFYKERACES